MNFSFSQIGTQYQLSKNACNVRAPEKHQCSNKTCVALHTIKKTLLLLRRLKIHTASTHEFATCIFCVYVQILVFFQIPAPFKNLDIGAEGTSGCYIFIFFGHSPRRPFFQIFKGGGDLEKLSNVPHTTINDIIATLSLFSSFFPMI